METIDVLRRRIESVKELRSVVRTMKALSAVSIRQYEKAVNSVNDYYGAVELGLCAVIRKEDARPARRRRGAEARLISIVFGSDHGLCGQFNDRAAALAIEDMKSRPEAEENRRLAAVGARMAEKLDAAGLTPDEIFANPSAVTGVSGAAEEILLAIDRASSGTGLDHVIFYHNAPLGGAAYRPVISRLAPINLKVFLKRGVRAWPPPSLPAYTIGRRELLSALAREFLFVTIFRAMAQSLASEHAARLAAMQSAEKGIEDHLNEITARFRTLRQEMITAELLDVVSGFEAQRDK